MPVASRAAGLPTYFGSNKIEDADRGTLTVLAKAIPKSSSNQDEFNRILSKVNDDNDDIRIAVDWVLKDNYSELNPSYSLKGGDGLLNESWVYEHNVAPLDDGIFAFVDSLYDTEIETPVFPSDSHWTMPRALESYNKVAEFLDLEPVNWNNIETYTAVDSWYGTRARAGLDVDYPNTTIDDTRNFSELVFYGLSDDDKLSGSKLGYRDLVLSGTANDSQLQNLKYSGYSYYYGGSGARIVNGGHNNGKNLLVVGDSYTHCLQRYFAANYAQTVVVLPGNEKVESTLEELIELYDIDDIVVMMHPLKAGIIADKSPAFLNGVAPDGDADEGE